MQGFLGQTHVGMPRSIQIFTSISAAHLSLNSKLFYKSFADLGSKHNPGMMATLQMRPFTSRISGISATTATTATTATSAIPSRVLFKDIPISARILGVSGLLPFLGLSMASTIWMPEALFLFAEIQSYYGAAILSFLGGIQWGCSVAASTPPSTTMATRLTASVLPSLAAFFSLLIPDVSIRLLVQAVSFLATLCWDMYASNPSRAWYPRWMMPLRYLLTSIVSCCLLLSSYLCWPPRKRKPEI